MMQELKPCPFCGSAPTLLIQQDFSVRIFCQNCGCSLFPVSPDDIGIVHSQDNEAWFNTDALRLVLQASASSWNRRVLEVKA